MSAEVKLRAIDVFRHTLRDHKALKKVAKEGMPKDEVERIAGPAIEEAMIKFAIYHVGLAMTKIKEDLKKPLQDSFEVYYSDDIKGNKTLGSVFDECYPPENIV